MNVLDYLAQLVFAVGVTAAGWRFMGVEDRRADARSRARDYRRDLHR